MCSHDSNNISYESSELWFYKTQNWFYDNILKFRQIIVRNKKKKTSSGDLGEEMLRNKFVI